MAREQMMCFVTPGAANAATAAGDLPASVQRRIERMCHAIGRIHFATLALLPPAPEASPMASPSLMLEVVVDESVPPAELIDLLLQHGFGALWRLYRAHWPGPPGATPVSKRDWLRAFLMQHANVAACGFVGNRDLDVAQIRGENDLCKQAASAFRSLPPHSFSDRAALGDHMARWARRFGGAWAAELPRRSLWRHGNLPDGVRLALLSVRLVVPFLALLGLLTVVGAIVLTSALLLAGAGLAVPDFVAAAVLFAALGLLAILLPVIFGAISGAVGIVVAFVVLLVFVLLLSAVMVVTVLMGVLWIPACMGALTALGGIALLAIGLSAALLLLVCAASNLRAPPFFPVVLASLASALLLLLVFGLTWWMFRVMGALNCGQDPLHLSVWPDPLTAICWASGAVCVVGAGLYGGPRLFGFLGRRLVEALKEADRPGPLPDVPLHTVHPSIQACEVALARRTGHMISLTEIRSRAHLRCLRFWLWFINLLGELYFTEGQLGRTGGIHFGHWHVIDNGRRLLFCSNFDGAFGGYLDAFIRGASQGLNLIWRNTELRPRQAARADHPAVRRARSFPPTRVHIFRGCKCEQAFKSYARDSMVPHLYRFEAYGLANDDIARARRLRVALQGQRTAVKDDQIARALES